MQYLEISIVTSGANFEILISQLSEIGFDSFLEEEDSLKAYVLESDFDKVKFDTLIDKWGEHISSYVVGELENKNWNEEWEKNYDPVEIDDSVYIYAHFHEEKPQFKYQIQITPQMSFGTGHHSTTTLMIKEEMNLSLSEKRVLDAGCGTGVLAIFAVMLGAKDVEAYDIDEWPYENSLANASLNKTDINILQGTISTVNLKNKEFDVVLANINKNVLLEEIGSYSEILVENGYLVLSGFYESDIEDISNKAQSYGLEFVRSNIMNDWACVVFQK